MCVFGGRGGEGGGGGGGAGVERERLNTFIWSMFLPFN